MLVIRLFTGLSPNVHPYLLPCTNSPDLLPSRFVLASAVLSVHPNHGQMLAYDFFRGRRKLCLPMGKRAGARDA